MLRRVPLGHPDQLDETQRLELRATHHGEHAIEAHALMTQEVKHHRVARYRRLEIGEVVGYRGRLDVHAASFLQLKLEANY
jgi:hypothetical protein